MVGYVRELDYAAEDRESAPARRLERIKEIIEAVDQRCMACDGPVTPTLQAMDQSELSAIYALACGKAENWRP